VTTNQARPQRPDTVVPITEIGLVLYPEDHAVGLQFVDGSGRQVFLWLPGSLLPALGRQLIDVVTDYPETTDWMPRFIERN
jgi:hypothetical protein